MAHDLITVIVERQVTNNQLIDNNSLVSVIKWYSSALTQAITSCSENGLIT